MRITILIASLVTLPLLVTACSDDPKDADAFDTLQACYDEHANEESLSVQQAIVVCCIDHPIGAAMTHPSCLGTQADCVSHVRAELAATVADADIQAACTTYIAMK
jgi:hypothetical protein